ncbi:MAG: N-acetylmuramoyl-L-alanine amidase [Clostridia bacterium]|nr:N-acetylmuramoyl-L-alanine amidase [Clostridia bacterium]
MFYVLDGKKLIAILLITVLTIAATMTIYANTQRSVSPYSLVIVDAGHGGMDGGAVGVNGSLEKDINFSIALKLKELLKKERIRLVMTRSKDDMINDKDVKSVKMSDLNNRVEIANKYKDALFVSIHMNSFKDAKQHGAQIFYSPNNPASENFANVMKGEFNKYVDPENKREIKNGGNIHILENITIPAVIAECGFISNAEEEKLLNSDDYQQKIANALLSSIKIMMEIKE